MAASLLSDKNQDALEDLIVGIEANGANLGIFIAVCDDVSFQATLIEQYEKALAEFRHCRLVLDKEEPSVSALIRHQVQTDETLSAGKPTVISILGTENLSALRLTSERSAQEVFYGYLQWTRESLREFPFAIVLWVSYQMLETLSRKAPDFWSWRKDVVRFESKKQTTIQLDRFFSQDSAGFSAPAGVLNSIPVADLETWINNIEAKTPDSPLLADLHTQAGELYANRLVQGNCLNYDAELETAIAHLERSIQQPSSHSLEAQIDRLILLGQLTALKKDTKGSQQLWQQAIGKAEVTGDLSVKADTLLKIANRATDLGDIQSAQTSFNQALDLYKNLQDKKQMGTTLSDMGLLTCQLGKTKKALSLWEKALSLQEEIDDKAGKAESLDNMANVVSQQGDTEKAIALWKTALNLHEQINEPKYQASVLNNMALVIAQQGDIDQALKLWHDSLEILERIGDVQGKAATLHNMAGVIAQQGDIDQALKLWHDSLEIKERIGDVKGKAATLANLAYWAGETGDRTKQLILNRQAAEAFGKIQAYGDLLTVLGNMGESAEEHNEQYLAQANWLMLRIQAPLTDTINLLIGLYQRIPKGDPLEALLGTTASFFCQTRGEDHPQLQQLQEISFKILLDAATEQGIDLEADNVFQTWMSDQQLNNSSIFLPQLSTHLETLIGNSWVFDTEPLRNSC